MSTEPPSHPASPSILSPAALDRRSRLRRGCGQDTADEEDNHGDEIAKLRGEALPYQTNRRRPVGGTAILSHYKGKGDNVSTGFTISNAASRLYYRTLLRAIRPPPASKDLTKRILGSNQTAQEHALQVRTVLYLVDRELIDAGEIKVLWLDEHGKARWDNRIEPGSLENLTLSLQDAQRLDEMIDGNVSRGSLLLL
ncbi:hypothetical protein BJX70DRAFT_403194 [Aspergillus crustosus]